LRKYEHFRKREGFGKNGTPNFTAVEIGRKIWGQSEAFFPKNKISIYTIIHEFFFTDI
jgi:hypothetical protein